MVEAPSRESAGFRRVEVTLDRLDGLERVKEVELPTTEPLDLRTEADALLSACRLDVDDLPKCAAGVDLGAG